MHTCIRVNEAEPALCCWGPRKVRAGTKEQECQSRQFNWPEARLITHVNSSCSLHRHMAEALAGKELVPLTYSVYRCQGRQFT